MRSQTRTDPSSLCTTTGLSATFSEDTVVDFFMINGRPVAARANTVLRRGLLGCDQRHRSRLGPAVRAIEKDDIEDPVAAVAAPVCRRQGVERLVLVSHDVPAAWAAKFQAVADVRSSARHARPATPTCCPISHAVHKIVTVGCG